MYVSKKGEPRIITVTTRDWIRTYTGWINSSTRKIQIVTPEGGLVHIYPSPDMTIEVD